MIVSVTLNPSVDRVLFVEKIHFGDTNRVIRTDTDAGGKGVNLSRVAAEMGARTIATGFLGGGSGAYVRHVLKVQGVIDRFVEVHSETRINTSVEDYSPSPPTTFNEKGAPVTEAEWQALVEQCTNSFGQADWVALGGSLPPGVPANAFATLTRLAHAHGCKVLLDADGEPMKLGLEAKPDLIKPNHNEAARLLGRALHTTQEVAEAALELRKLGIDWVIVSRGKDGAVLATADGSWNGSSPEVKVRSTIGSGDSLLGGFLWAIEEKKPLDEALKWGMAAGAATATTDGSEIARRPVVEALYGEATVNALT